MYVLLDTFYLQRIKYVEQRNLEAPVKSMSVGLVGHRQQQTILKAKKHAQKNAMIALDVPITSGLMITVVGLKQAAV